MKPPETCRTSLIVTDSLGLHARPAALLAKMAQQYDADIVMGCGRKKVNDKSVLGIMTLYVLKGAKVTIVAEGHDASAAIIAMEALFASSFLEATVAT